MLKYSFAIAALLGKVDALHLQQSAPHRLHEHSQIQTMLKNNLKQDGFEYSCHASVDRMQNDPSNSWTAFVNSQNANSKWEDPGFPAAESSMKWPQRWGQEDPDYAPPDGLQWLRPTQMEAYGDQFQPRDPSLWGSSGMPRPNGVSQNQLGDCWFLAAASSVSEVPDRIRRIVWNEEYNSNGAFRFYFWVKNGWFAVNVDDQIPSGDYGRPWATWPSTSGAWWMPLLEKAYAKLDVNYDNLIAGWGIEGLRTLTGMPTISIYHEPSQYNKFLPMHKYFASKNFPMTSGCCYNGGVYSLISGHAYSILDVAELTDSSGNVVHTIAKMRNPWNQEHYNGPWRDDDPNWTPEWRQQVDLQEANDGIFWMEYDVFLSYFMNTGVAFYDEYAHYSVQEINFSQTYGYFQFNNPESQHLYLTGEMHSRRHFPRTSDCQPNNNAVLYLMDSNWNIIDDQYGVIGDSGFQTIGSLDNELPAGDYILYLSNMYPDMGPIEFSLNIYGKNSGIQLSELEQWS